jgi:hypothetical protein
MYGLVYLFLLPIGIEKLLHIPLKSIHFHEDKSLSLSYFLAHLPIVNLTTVDRQTIQPLVEGSRILIRGGACPDHCIVQRPIVSATNVGPAWLARPLVIDWLTYGGE